jgi:hypothetical protein
VGVLAEVAALRSSIGQRGGVDIVGSGRALGGHPEYACDFLDPPNK